MSEATFFVRQRGYTVKRVEIEIDPGEMFDEAKSISLDLATMFSCEVAFEFNGHDYLATGGEVVHHCGGGDLRGGKFSCAPLIP